MNVSKPKNFTLVTYKPGADRTEKIRRSTTKSIRRFSEKLRRLKGEIDCYIRVSYHGEWYNDGFYTDKDELMKAYKAFIER